jgi:lysophospholipase L1-like esterase
LIKIFFNGVDMDNKIGLLAVCFLLMLIMPLCANSADSVVIDGDLRISGLGSLVFPDGSVQNSATVKGPKGDTGPTGPQGPPGSAESSYSTLNYYALGDSITYGSGISYANVVNSKLNFNSFTELAVPGATAMPYTGLNELASQVYSIGANADIITVLIGFNDYHYANPVGDTNAVLQKPYASLDKTLSFSEAFRFCLETIKRNHEQARIYVILPLQTTAFAQVPLDMFRTAEINIANFLSIPVIYANTESGLWAGGSFIPDGIHPNNTGQGILGNYIARKIIGL